jgi:hypothetical protein
MILILWILQILVILGTPTDSYELLRLLIIVMLLYIYSGLTSCQLKHHQAIHSILCCAYNHSYICDFYTMATRLDGQSPLIPDPRSIPELAVTTTACRKISPPANCRSQRFDRRTLTLPTLRQSIRLSPYRDTSPSTPPPQTTHPPRPRHQHQHQPRAH